MTRSTLRDVVIASAVRMQSNVHFGCANQAGEENRDVARMALLLAGLPQHVGGVTVNRLCTSGLAAVKMVCELARDAS